MIGASAVSAGVIWLLLLTVTSSTVPRRQLATSGGARPADGGCIRPLRRVEMLDVNLDSISYRLREIHIRHDVKVGGLWESR